MPSDLPTGRQIQFPPLDPNECVLYIDHMQNEFAHPDGKFNGVLKYLKKHNAIENIKKVIKACRKAKVPIIYHTEVWRPGYPELRLQRRGYVLGSARYYELDKSGVCIKDTWGGQVIDELRPEPEDFVIDSPKVDAFTGTDFDIILRNLERGVLILCGVETNLGVEMTARSASEYDYGVVVLYDCTDRSREEYAEATFKHIFPMYGRVAMSDEIVAEFEQALHKAVV